MPRVLPLIKDETMMVQWNNSAFSYDNMVRIRTAMDGSCFFHAIAKGFFIPYRKGDVNRQEFIRHWRSELANTLGGPVDPKNPTGYKHYDILAKGKLAESSESIPEMKLINMQSELNSDNPISNIYNEFISDLLEIDIYLLDLEKEDVYMTGTDTEIIHKGRPSIVIGYLSDHYELMGVLDKKENRIITLFQPDSGFIQAIRMRMAILQERSNDEKKDEMKEEKKEEKKGRKNSKKF